MEKRKKLVSLISTEGKTPEEIYKEAMEAIKKFNTVLEESQKESKEKKTDKS